MGDELVRNRKKDIFGNVFQSVRKQKRGVKRNLENRDYANSKGRKKRKSADVPSDFAAIEVNNSVESGKVCFSKMISPINVSKFFERVWEKKPLCVIRRKPDFYEDVCTMEDFKSALATQEVLFTENIDVTSYVDGVKMTENHVGRATPELVFNFYKKGRSIRLLNPQTFIRKVRSFTTELQDYFRCFVGSNIYLTPGNSQGFAPHYDDVEAFVLQLAGRKEWRVYNPRNGEELPRFSSGNFTDADIGEPILKVILEPGDLLYFPRGMIHQARALEEGSMHITVSCYQRNSWADFLEKLLPVALQSAIEEDVEYRRGLPRTYLDHLGLVASDKESNAREKIISQLKNLVHKLTDYLPIDSCADQFGKSFMHDALPPILNQGERKHAAKDYPDGLKKLRTLWNRDLKVKLVRAYSCRLVCEGEKIRLYYNTKNGLIYHEVGHRSMRLTRTWTIIAEVLLQQYPGFTDCRELVSAVGGTKHLDEVLDFIEELRKRSLVLFNKIFSTPESE